MTRLYELAKELETPAKDLSKLAAQVGVVVKNHFTDLSEEQVKLIKAELKRPTAAATEPVTPVIVTPEVSDAKQPEGRRVRRVISIKKNDEGVSTVRRKAAKPIDEPPKVSIKLIDVADPLQEEAVVAPSPDTQVEGDALLEQPNLQGAEGAKAPEKQAAPQETGAEKNTARVGVIRRVRAGEVDASGKIKIGVVHAKDRKGPVTPPRGDNTTNGPAHNYTSPVSVSKKEQLRLEEEAKNKRVTGKGKDNFGSIKGGAHKNLKNIDIEQRSDRPMGRRRYTKFVNRKREPKVKHTFQPRKKDLVVGESITVGDLAGLIGIRASEIIKTLIALGIMATVTESIEGETAALVAQEHKIELKVEINSIEDSLAQAQDLDENLMDRSPVVTIMGHVDHGKTSLLDRIRSTNVTSGEAGGITQHIGAYRVGTPAGDITFLDTPGHEAFTAMRARGANVTDIVILVVAADDGPRPQTLEAIHHAKAAEVPIIVAINKIDKPGATVEKVTQELMAHELVAEEFGGDTPMIPVSAHTGEGLDKLLEAIQLQAEIMELKANPNRQATGAVIESKLEKSRGNMATILIQNGTLKIGDNYVVGCEWGRVRALWDDQGKKIDTAGPTVPVEIVGLKGLPKSGDQFIVGSDEKQVRQIAETRAYKEKEAAQAKAHMIRLENLFEDAASEQKELNLIIKTDVVGSMEALSDSLAKLGNEEVTVKIIHAAVGAITRTDVVLASASQAIILGFNTRPDNSAKQTAAEDSVEIRIYSVIYDAIEDVNKALEGMLDPIIREELQGKAEVAEAFNIPKIGMIAGCKVLEGKISRDAPVRVIRDNIMIYDGKLSSLRRFKDNVKEVAQGFECGIGIQSYNDVRTGDVIECYKRLETSATL